MCAEALNKVGLYFTTKTFLKIRETVEGCKALALPTQPWLNLWHAYGPPSPTRSEPWAQPGGAPNLSPTEGGNVKLNSNNLDFIFIWDDKL